MLYIPLVTHCQPHHTSSLSSLGTFYFVTSCHPLSSGEYWPWEARHKQLASGDMVPFYGFKYLGRLAVEEPWPAPNVRAQTPMLEPIAISCTPPYALPYALPYPITYHWTGPASLPGHLG